MNGVMTEKLKESVQSVLPVGIIVLLLNFTIAPMPTGTLMMFLTGMVLLIVGMSIFTLGAELSMIPMGETIGSVLTKSRKLWLMVVSSFILGVVVTVAEPDLQVLTKQVPAVPDAALIASVACGVGIFLVIALLRILFQMNLSHVLIVSYVFVFIIAALTAPDYLAVSFDSGGVTTGPITVPFILALGLGISAVRGGSTAEEDSFGLCALCSIGPILAVLITGMFFDPSGTGFAFESAATVDSVSELIALFANGFLQFFKEVCIVLLPIVVIFIFLQLIHLKLPKIKMIRIMVGIVYTLVGLSVFLTGVNIGFMPAGTYLGRSIASLPYRWILIPLSAVIGCCVVFAEPAVHVLNNQVEDITSGAISGRMMMVGLSIGVGLALALAMIRIMTHTSIWFFLLPGYAIALAMTFFSPKIFTAIAFDSGGVAAGTMAAAFLLPFASGACDALGGNIMTDAFGIIAMVAMMPIITVQAIGIIYRIKLDRAEKAEEADNVLPEEGVASPEFSGENPEFPEESEENKGKVENPIANSEETSENRTDGDNSLEREE
ncbi:DUF1538 domain-containing protein [Clostridium sp. KNHs216]|uniref:DUF1538 domain-containing protein n=1 Tax=Clostridium sp. KNHs216 TaxID=1550235 RepID=UPI001154D131|nr:DUF1538 domain-containing protein [Clostridium sp. KNHs216]TQI67099.1 uncharacterized protein DUF1538 [Clostridium sp. KNHs216]